MKAITKYFVGYSIEISHSVDNVKEHAHEHSVEVNMMISIGGKMATNWIEGIDALIRKEVMFYDEAYLNEHEEFGGNATIENLAEVLYERIVRLLEPKGVILHRLSIGETPLRQYIITDRT